jgi:hypothetical protein
LAKKHNLNFSPKTDDFGESFAKRINYFTVLGALEKAMNKN